MAMLLLLPSLFFLKFCFRVVSFAFCVSNSYRRPLYLQKSWPPTGVKVEFNSCWLQNKKPNTLWMLPEVVKFFLKFNNLYACWCHIQSIVRCLSYERGFLFVQLLVYWPSSSYVLLSIHYFKQMWYQVCALGRCSMLSKYKDLNR